MRQRRRRGQGEVASCPNAPEAEAAPLLELRCQARSLFEQFAKTLVPGVQSEIDQIRDLPAPEGDEETVANILDTAQEGVDQIEQDPSLAVRGGKLDEASRLAGDYGLYECAD